MQMDQITQQNAALVEQAAPASQSMSEQARRLIGLTEHYRIDAAITRSDEQGLQAVAWCNLPFTKGHGTPADGRSTTRSPLNRFIAAPKACR